MRQFNTPARKVYSLRFTPDGSRIYLLSAETRITPERIVALPQHAYCVDTHSGGIIGDWFFGAGEVAIFTPDFCSIYYLPTHEPYALLTGGELHRFDLDRGEGQPVSEVGPWDVGYWVAQSFRSAITPDGHLLALGVVSPRHDGDAVLRLRVSQRVVLEPIQTGVACLAYSFDGRWLATGAPSTGVRVWTGSDLTGQWDSPARHLAWSPDGQLAWGIGGELNLARPGTGEQVRWWGGLPGELSALCFSPDGRLLLTGTGRGVCAFHDPTAGQVRAVFDWGIGAIHSVAFSPDGLTCAAGGEGGRVVVWDVDA